MKKIFLLVCMAMFSAINLLAQEIIDRNFMITKNINWFSIPSTGTVEMKGNCKLEVINFGAIGNTIIMTLDLPEVKKVDPNINLECAWTGKNVHLAKVPDGYAIVRGTNTLCGALVKTEKNGEIQWIASLLTNEGCIPDIHVGMTRFAVEQIFGDLGLSKFIFEKNDGNMKVYTLKWLDMKKKYHWFGRDDYHYEMTNDKTYGYFWFNANDKLVKWILP